MFGGVRSSGVNRRIAWSVRWIGAIFRAIAVVVRGIGGEARGLGLSAVDWVGTSHTVVCGFGTVRGVGWTEGARGRDWDGDAQFR